MLPFLDRLKRLMDFGLTEYQARVYLTLLGMGSATAAQLAVQSKVPRTRIYGTVQQLHEKGLVHIIPETPLKYTPVSFKVFMEKTITGLRDEASNMELNIDGLSKEFETAAIKTQPEKTGRFEIFYGRRNVRDKLLEMYTAAKKDIIVVGTSSSPKRIVRTTLPMMETKAKEGVKIRYVFPTSVKNSPEVKRFVFADMQFIKGNPTMHFGIVDSNETILVHRIPNDEDPVKGDDIAIWTSDKAIVDAMKSFAEDFWVRGQQIAGTGNHIVDGIFKTFEAFGMADSDALFGTMAKALGSEIAKEFKSTDDLRLAKEMSDLWAKRVLGEFRIEKEKPLEIVVNGFFDCAELPEQVQKDKPHCGFLRILVEQIFAERTGKPTSVKLECLGNNGCKLTVSHT